MSERQKTTFVPVLALKKGAVASDLEFYMKGLGAIEHQRWSNDDGSIHVSEMTIDGALFHFHEESSQSGKFSPEAHHGITTTIGLMVDDVDAVMNSALAAGAKEYSPPQNYDYGYRQGEFIDLLGHHWLIEKRI